MNFKELREKEKLSLDKLSELTGYHKSDLNRIENSKRQPGINKAKKILKALGYDLLIKKREE